MSFKTPLALLFIASLICFHSQANPLKVEHVANAGVKISSGNQVVYVDALFGPHPRFNFLSNEAYAEMVEQGASVALASHVHPDHFGRHRAAQFLQANADTLFIAPPQVMNLLQKSLEHAHLHAPALKGFETADYAHRGVSVTVLNFPHMSPELTADIQNYAYLIELNGWKVLHVGDGGITAKIIEGLQLAKRDIDVTLFHDLCPAQPDCVERLEQVGAKHVAFYHMTDNRTQPVGAWINKHYPSAHMLVTGQRPLILHRE